MENKNILLIGERYSLNLGDGVICEVVKNFIEKALPGKNIIELDMSLNMKYSLQQVEEFKGIEKEIEFIRRCGRLALLKCNIDIGLVRFGKKFRHYYSHIENIIKSNDPVAIVFAGGQMFMDVFFSRIEDTVVLADKYNIPVYFNACGCANYLSDDLKKRLISLFRKKIVKSVSVRDGFNKLNRLYPSIQDTMDSAILSFRYYNKGIKNEIIGIGIMISPYCDVLKQVKYWVRFLNKLKDQNVKFQLFCNGAIEDYAFANFIVKKINFDNKAYSLLAERPVTPRQLVEQISSYKIIITMRLHSLIVAYSMNVPSIVFSWDNKVKEFCEKAEIEEYCFPVFSDIKKVINAVERLKIEKRYFSKREQCIKYAEDNLEKLCKVIDDI